MTNSELKQAREWADKTLNNYPFPSHEGVAARLIQSLPDAWVDAERMKAIIADMDHCLKTEATADFSKGIDNATTTWRDALKALITPKLPTLADMTEEERKACLWMQADHASHGRVILVVTLHDSVQFLKQSGGWMTAWQNNFKQITPLPDLPKLKWPGAGAAEPPALPDGMRLADHPDFGRVVVSPKMDSESEYKVFHSDRENRSGADWHYAHESKLTFLDGE